VYKILRGFGWFQGVLTCLAARKTSLDLQMIVADQPSDWNNDFAGDAIES